MRDAERRTGLLRAVGAVAPVAYNGSKIRKRCDQSLLRYAGLTVEILRQMRLRSRERDDR